MRRLAANANAALYKCGREYWIINYGRDVGPCKFSEIALNDESDNYTVQHALAYFTRNNGSPDWIHERINNY